ncbi:MAG: permease prefix domain 1-containing protein [Oscillospiraceae bacterium]
MKKVSFEYYANKAAGYIKYKPERKEVYEELYAHLEDKFDGLVSAGLPEREAEKLTLRAMGDADEVGRALAKVHRPFWGYFLRLTKVLLVITVLQFFISVFNLPEYLDRWSGESDVEQRLWNSPEAGEVFYYPDCRDSSDGYTFTVTRVMTHDAKTESGEEYHPFYFTVKSFNLRLWIDCAEVREFYAVDSFGNLYYPDSTIPREKAERSLVGNYYYDGPFTYKYEMWLEGYVGGAEWVEIRYDDFGRDICLHIDLTEGVTYEAD